MVENMQPIAKRCRASGISPATMGYAKKESGHNPDGQVGKKKSEYALQLVEKQKVKFVYGIVEKQLRMCHEKAVHIPGKTGENLLTFVKCHLDNVVYRLDFAMTHREVHQLVDYDHFIANGQWMDIPPCLVKAGDAIGVKESSRSSARLKCLAGEDAPTALVPRWLERDKNALKGTMVRMPAREDTGLSVEEHLIVELYSG